MSVKSNVVGARSSSVTLGQASMAAQEQLNHAEMAASAEAILC